MTEPDFSIPVTYFEEDRMKCSTEVYNAISLLALDRDKYLQVCINHVYKCVHIK